MEMFALPITAIVVVLSKAQILRPSVVLEPMGLRPDIVILKPIVEGPEDPVLVRALGLAHAPGP